MTDLVKRASSAGLGPVLARRPDLADEVARLAKGARSAASRKALASDWRIFEAWCQENGAPAMPADPETLAAFLVDQARTKALATVLRYRASISTMHRMAAKPSPAGDARVREVLKGLSRERPARGVQKEAATAAMIERLPHELAVDLRDRAVILVGLFGALRRGSICALDVEDLRWVDEGVVVTLRRSKTDQAGEGAFIGLPKRDDETCPVAALRAWLDFSKIEAGSVFCAITKGGRVLPRRLSPSRVAKIVKRVAKLAGLDPAGFGGHSLRAGYVTEARAAGLDWPTIMEQTGHKKLATVKKYARGAVDVFRSTRVAELFPRKP